MDFAHWLLLTWTVVVFYVLGVTWFAQIVVYPLLGRVGESEYVDYHLLYSSRIPLPVIVPGFASFLLPLALAFLGPDSVATWTYVANVACGLAGLFVTMALGDTAPYSPRERGQAGGGDPRAHPLQLAADALDHRLGHPDGAHGDRCLQSELTRRIGWAHVRTGSTAADRRSSPISWRPSRPLTSRNSTLVSAG